MFKLIGKKNDKYLVLDTEDNAVDEFTYNQIINCVEKGFKIEGCKKTSNGYYFEIDDSNYYNCGKNGWRRRRSLSSRVGETNKANNGLMMTIIAYRRSDDIDIQFEDGVIVYNRCYKNFSIGAIEHPEHKDKVNETCKVVKLGETNRANNGLIMTIIAYRRSDDIDIQFEDGVIVYNKAYTMFKRGSIKHPNISSYKGGKNQYCSFSIDNKVGEKIKANNGLMMTIIAYRNTLDIDIQFEDGTIVYNKTYGNFRIGNIGHPTYKSRSKENKVGMVSIANSGLLITIIACDDFNNIDIQFEDGAISRGKHLKEFKAGKIKHPKITRNGVGGLYCFKLDGYAYRLKDKQDVFYFCECTKCRCKDILSPKQMLEHKCEV